MPKAKREQNCYVCEEADTMRMTFMVCEECSRPFCSRHGDSKLEACNRCLESGEET